VTGGRAASAARAALVLLGDLAPGLRESARRESSRRRMVWVGIAVVLALAPVVFNLSRGGATAASASVELFPRPVGPFPAVRSPDFFRGLLSDPVLRAQMRLHVGATDYRTVTLRPNRARGTVVVTVTAGSPQRARDVVSSLGPQLAGGSGRRLTLRLPRVLALIRSRLHTAPRRGVVRRRLERRLDRIRRLGGVVPDAVVLSPVSTSERSTTWADRLASALPGKTPRRHSPVWAGFAGLLLASGIWASSLALATSGAVRRRALICLTRRQERPRTIQFPSDQAPTPLEPVRAMSRLQRTVWLGALAVPVLVTLISVMRLGVNVPFWDEWTMVPLLQKLRDGSLSFNDLWAQHNEHRPLFPRAIDLGLASATSWDIRAELYFNFAVATGGFLAIAAALRRSLDRAGFMVATVVAAFIYFSLVQWENWLWGWQLGWFLSGAAVAAALWALSSIADRSWRWGLALAGAGGVVASYSLGNGVLIWLAGAVVLVLKRKPLRVWIALAVLTIGSYFYHYHSAPGEPSQTIFLHRPVQFVEYLLIFLGRMFAPSSGLGMLVGAALLVSFAACLVHVVRHRDDDVLLDRAAFWAGLGVFGLASAVLTVIARQGLGKEAAMFSRYSTVAALFAIATTALVFVVVRSPEVMGWGISPTLRWRARTVVAVLLVLAVIGNTPAGLRSLRKQSKRFEAIAACVHKAQAGDPCLRMSASQPSPYLTTQSAWIEYLRSERLGGF
jgi:hypothetical protein